MGHVVVSSLVQFGVLDQQCGDRRRQYRICCCRRLLGALHRSRAGPQCLVDGVDPFRQLSGPAGVGFDCSVRRLDLGQQCGGGLDAASSRGFVEGLQRLVLRGQDLSGSIQLVRRTGSALRGLPGLPHECIGSSLVRQSVGDGAEKLCLVSQIRDRRLQSLDRLRQRGGFRFCFPELSRPCGRPLPFGLSFVPLELHFLQLLEQERNLVGFGCRVPCPVLCDLTHRIDTLVSEDPLQHPVTLTGPCFEELGESSLRQQHRSPERIEVHAEEFGQTFVHVRFERHLLHRLDIGIVAREAVQRVLAGAGASQRSDRLPHVAVDRETQRDRRGICSLVNQRFGRAADRRRPAVQGERDRIQDR